MTTTDRAFIAAIQQSAAWPEPQPSVDSAAGGPHYEPTTATASGKAPLSEHLARRRAAAPPAAASAPRPEAEVILAMPLRPGVEVQEFNWPELSERLATDARTQLLDVLSAVTAGCDQDRTPALAFVGSRPGVGATATLLATGQLVESVGGKVAILDVSPAAGAASLLGVRRSHFPSGPIDGALIDDLLVTSRRGETSVLAAGVAPDRQFLTAAINRLVSTHDLVLIDAGDADSAASSLAGLGATTPSVLLLDSADGNDHQRRQANATLAALGVTPIGLVETLATRC